MSVATAAKIKLLSECVDYKVTANKEVGDLSRIKVLDNRLLLAIYFRPEKISGIIRPQSNVEEDAYQSKVGLVLKKGVWAFVNDADKDFRGDTAEVGDWVLYRASDGFPTSLKGVPCRIVRDDQIMMVVDNPQDWF